MVFAYWNKFWGNDIPDSEYINKNKVGFFRNNKSMIQLLRFKKCNNQLCIVIKKNNV